MLFGFFVVGGKALGEAGMSPLRRTREFVSAERRRGEESAHSLETEESCLTMLLCYLILDGILDAMVSNLPPAYFRFGYGDSAEYLNKANWVIGASGSLIYPV